LYGCASGPSKIKENESFSSFINGNISASLNSLEEANRDIENKDITYHLNKSTLLRLNGKGDLSQSTDNLFKADLVVDNWISEAKLNIGKTTNEFASYVMASKSRNIYSPKDYEKSFISYSLVLNHLLNGRGDLALVNAKRIAERETTISRFNELKYSAIQQREKESSAKNNQIFSDINNINGYPVQLLDSFEVNSLKNSYQNAAAHYLAAFVFEKEGEPGLAAPGYRLALELKKNNILFANSLRDLDSKISNLTNQATSEVLIISESGNIPLLETHRSNLTFNTRKGPRIVTIRLPIIKSKINTFGFGSIKLGDKFVPLFEAVNTDSLVRRQLKDEMPTHILKATTQAIVQIIAQEAAQAAAEKNNRNNSGMAGAIASIAVGAALSVGDTDTRMWSNLPANIHMGRISIPKGSTQLVIQSPNGPQSFNVNITQKYQVIYIRSLGTKPFVIH
jgi:hypothetical protein